MCALCLQCGRWQGGRDRVCQLCRLCLSIRHIGKNSSFTEEDFDWTVDQLSVILGTLSSRVLVGPPLDSGGSRSPKEKEDRRRTSSKASPESGRRGRESGPVPPAKDLAKGPSVPPPPRVRSKEETKSPSPRERERSRRRRRDKSPSVRSADKKEDKTSGARRSKERDGPKEEVDKEPPKKDWKPSLRDSKTPGTDETGSERPATPPRAPTELRSRVDAESSRPPPSTQEEWGDSHQYSEWDESHYYGDYWGWPYYSYPDYSAGYSKGFKGNKGKGSFQWVPKGKGKGTSSGGPYKKKKNNKGLNRPIWWEQHKGRVKGSGKGAKSGKSKGEPVPEGAAPNSATPAAPEAPETIAPPAEAPEGGASETPPTDTLEGGAPASAEAALAERARSWADAT